MCYFFTLENILIFIQSSTNFGPRHYFEPRHDRNEPNYSISNSRYIYFPHVSLSSLSSRLSFIMSVFHHGFHFQKFFSTTQYESYHRMKKILDAFQEASGMRYNEKKTFIHIPKGMVISTPFTTLTSSGTEYLGFRVNQHGLMDNTRDKVEAICNSIKAAKDATLSVFGRVRALKSYAYSKLWYTTSIHGIREDTVKIINRYTNWFLWHNKDKIPEESKWAPIGKERAARPTHNGGIDLWDLEYKIQARQIQWFARMITHPNLPWVKIAMHITKNAVAPMWIAPNSTNLPKNSFIYKMFSTVALVRQDVNSAFFTDCGLCPVTLEKALGPTTHDSVTIPITPTIVRNNQYKIQQKDWGTVMFTVNGKNYEQTLQTTVPTSAQLYHTINNINLSDEWRVPLQVKYDQDGFITKTQTLLLSQNQPRPTLHPVWCVQKQKRPSVLW